MPLYVNLIVLYIKNVMVLSRHMPLPHSDPFQTLLRPFHLTETGNNETALICNIGFRYLHTRFIINTS